MCAIIFEGAFSLLSFLATRNFSNTLTFGPDLTSISQTNSKLKIFYYEIKTTSRSYSDLSDASLQQ